MTRAAPVQGLRSAIGFLTVAPGGGVPEPASLRWFAPVGALVGAAVGLVAVEARHLWPVLVAGVLAVAVDAVLTGGLHLDGLADSADGLLPPVGRERRLAIMATPDVGAFGVVALVVCIGLRATSLASVDDVATVAAIWAAARAMSALVVLHVPYARDDGLVTAFRPPGGTNTERTLNVVAVAACAVGAAAVDARAGVAVAACVVTSVVVVLAARRRIEGFSGDVLGAAIVLSETVALLVAVSQ